MNSAPVLSIKEREDRERGLENGGEKEEEEAVLSSSMFSPSFLSFSLSLDYESCVPTG
jgi:hypothetical protein